MDKKKEIKLEQLKEIMDDKKAVSTILAKVDKYIEKVEETHRGTKESEMERINKFTKNLIDKMHEHQEIGDNEYMKIQSNMVNLYSGQQFLKKKKKIMQ